MSNASFRSALLAMLIATAACDAQAQAALKDPTRPSKTTLASPATEAAEAAPDKPPTVSLLLVAPGRRYALISGELLAPGDTGAMGKLVSVTIEDAVLQSTEGRKSLGLFPDVSKLQTPPRPPAAAEKSPGIRK